MIVKSGKLPPHEPLTMDRCQRLEDNGFAYLAEVGRKYAVDRPRWWHRLRRAA